MTLQKLLSLTDKDTTVILVSDHGFVSDHKRQSHTPMEPAGPANDHREHGVFLASGPGIKKDERLYGASLLDITPSILHIFGLPVGEDMDGRVLTEIFDTSKPVETIDSWEKVEGFCGSLSLEAEEDPLMAQEALQQLVELGYIEKPDEDADKAVKSATKELQYNLSRVLTGAGKSKKALPVIEQLHLEHPDDARFAIRYARCLFDCSSYQESLDILKIQEEKLLEKRLSKDEIKKLHLELDKARSKKIIDEMEKKSASKISKELKAQNQNISDLMQVLLMKSENSVKLGDVDNGFREMDRILVEFGRNTTVLYTYASMLTRTKKWDKAAEIYKEVMKNNPEYYPALHGYGLCLLRKDKPQEALDYLLQAISLQFYNPRAHFHVGQALYALEEYSEAATALEVCLKLIPTFNNARNLLINIYANNLNNNDRADALKTYFESGEILENEISKENEPLIVSGQQKNKNITKDDIVVVSGLPRSGTSLMMQILKKSGMEILTDEAREADDSNPKGYFEFEKVKNIVKDKSWLPQAQGKCVKVVSHLLHFLPAKYNYKVIFMLRDIKEIVASQGEMLVRDGKSSGKTFRADLLHNYSEHLKKVTTYLSRKHNMQVLFLDYNKILAGSESELESLKSFLPDSVDIDMAKSVIDPSLYRVKGN
jgi:tetratricopeptide (TPR) repeat protein